jgi:hypothetical protein
MAVWLSEIVLECFDFPSSNLFQGLQTEHCWSCPCLTMVQH